MQFTYLLALKSSDDIFIINGNIRPYKSGIYEYNGDSFDYNNDASHIVSNGPLSRSIKLMVYARGNNPGIMYEYKIPVPSAALSEEEEQQTQWNELGQPLAEVDENVSKSHTRNNERRRRKFSWKLLGFGQCNRSCGPGVQAPIFRCIRDSPTRYYTPKRCAAVEKPVFSIDIYQCNRGLCHAFWRLHSSSAACNCTAENETFGVRALKVQCVQEQISGKVEVVAEKLCDSKLKPNDTELCKCIELSTRKVVTRATTTEKSKNIYARLTSGTTPTGLPLRRHLRNERVDKTGVWLMSNWQEQCNEVACYAGGSFEYRSIYCDRTAPFTDLCDLRYTPQQKRNCVKCLDEGVWLTSEWSNCTGDCFNLQRQRIVLCMQRGVAVDDKACVTVKPTSVEKCKHTEVDFCAPKWHYSEWSEVSFI